MYMRSIRKHILRFELAGEEGSSEQEFPELSLGLPSLLRRDGLSTQVDDGGVNEKVVGDFDDVGSRITSDSLDFEADQRRRSSIYREVLQSYDELRRRSENLEEAKSKILSYTPGAWIEMVGGMKLSDYDVPKTASLLLIGPRGSGKSSLVNKISRVFEDDKFASERAQVSYNSSVGDGTYFLQEYMIPRGSTSFCLNDTRSLSDESYENMEMLKRWMTKGVRHGELAIRDSDSSSLKTIMKSKARHNGYKSSEARMVNFVIYVVNGLSVLKSMNSNDEAGMQYTQLISTTFNCPFLSFKDDKPVIVVTHGDLLSLSDRAMIRVHLGELLGIPPKKQIFDIPEISDPMTELTIVDMLRYSLEHADRNLPGKGWSMGKVVTVPLSTCLLLFLILGIAIISAHILGSHSHHAHMRRARQSNTRIDWHAIRHLWLGTDYD
ncbi:hypothetical protein F0562_021715 [Nyssa sinensis]|uniref:G domain-containing protein n=1 Tax=Nyssa sinensis TaxID=561372 RepID=A0A5J5BL32_9ASTE|nr:hypothetical protein F0562_021715 [Nyssa sinensis]